MKKLVLVAAIIALVACTNEYSSIPLESQIMTVGFASDARVQLLDGHKTVWNQGDMISVFYKNDVNSCWRYRGTDKASEGVITMVSTPADPTATFHDIYGIYPYNPDYSVNTFGELVFTIPTEQNWLNGSYGIGDNIMVAIGENENLSFKNIFGYLQLQLKGSEGIKHIIFRGNNNEQLTGASKYDPFIMKSVFTDDAGKAITLSCADVTLRTDEVQTFHIAIIPQVFENGFNIEVETTNGVVFKHKTKKRIEIKRNTIHPMSSLATSDMECIRPIIHYTASSKITPNRTNVFGANLISNVWDATTGEGVIEFDNKVTKIGDYAFYESNIKSIEIPASVTEIGYAAFAYSKISSITIPACVTSIGGCAFYSSQVSTIYCKPTVPPAVGHSEHRDVNYAVQLYALPHKSGTKIYVPRESYDAYTQYTNSSSGTYQYNWSLYKNYIEPYDFIE